MAKLKMASVLKRLEAEELILPYFENAMLADKWPDKYSIEVDSRPYYGLTDTEGEARETGPGDGFFHPSTHPLLGKRLLWYMFHPKYAPLLLWEKRTITSMMTLTMGSALHACIQTQMVMAGILREENVEVEFVNRESNSRGRLDLIADHPTYGLVPVEVKTMNSFSFRKLEEVKPSWEVQLSIAMTELGFDFGILLVVESGWPYTMREFRVRRNDELVSSVYEKYGQVLEAVEFDRPPEFCCEKGSATMKSCPARYECHLSDETPPPAVELGLPGIKKGPVQ